MVSPNEAKALMDLLMEVDEHTMSEILKDLTPIELAALTDALRAAEAQSGGQSSYELLPHQIPPDPSGDWLGWLLLGGRGAGKTLASARYTMEHVHGPPCDPNLPGGHRMLIVGPSQLDAVDSCFHGPSGLGTLDPTARLTTRKDGTVVLWESGAVARVAGALNPADVESLRAKGNNCFAWLEELAAWRMLSDPRRDPDGNRDALSHILLGLRVGPKPRWVASTTPKPRPSLVKLTERDTVVVSTAPTSANPHLPTHIKQELEDRFGGSRLGRQELEAEILSDVEGALWDGDTLELYRLQPDEVLFPDDEDPRRLKVIGVDPPGGSTECGLVAMSIVRDCPCGLSDGRLPHLLIEEDVSIQGPPSTWARRVIAMWETWDADVIVGEVNYGGDMVESVLLSENVRAPVKTVRATRGKAVRAEPIATMTEQGRVHLVGTLAELEDEMTGWVPSDSYSESPNRLDAMVWAATYLLERMGPRSARAGVAAAAPSSRAIIRTRGDGRKIPAVLRNSTSTKESSTVVAVPSPVRQGDIFRGPFPN